MLFYKGVDPTQANLLKIPGSKSSHFSMLIQPRTQGFLATAWP